jgi:hypothetical protein
VKHDEGDEIKNLFAWNNSHNLRKRMFELVQEEEVDNKETHQDL